MTITHIRTLAYILLVTLLLACNSKGDAPKTQDKKLTPADSTLLIAVMPTLDCLPLYVAEASGLFENQHINVRLVKYNAQMDCDTALLRGRVHGAFTDLVRAEHLRKKGASLKELGR